MIVYNITTKVDHAIDIEWTSWQKEIHIPEVMATGLFIEHRFFKLLEHDDEEGKIFVTQFVTNSIEDYQLYFLSHLALAKKKSAEKWGERALSFSTLLQNVE